jgi:hypothetical protein
LSRRTFILIQVEHLKNEKKKLWSPQSLRRKKFWLTFMILSVTVWANFYVYVFSPKCRLAQVAPWNLCTLLWMQLRKSSVGQMTWYKSFVWWWPTSSPPPLASRRGRSHLRTSPSHTCALSCWLSPCPLSPGWTWRSRHRLLLHWSHQPRSDWSPTAPLHPVAVGTR